MFILRFATRLCVLAMLSLTPYVTQAVETQVVLTPEMFEAGKLLLHLNKIKVSTAKSVGEIRSSSGLVYLGIPATTPFQIDLSGLAAFAAFELGKMESDSLEISLSDNGLLVRMKMHQVDGPAGTSSLGGRVDVKDLVVNLRLVAAQSGGRLKLEPADVKLDGSFIASGGPLGFLLRRSIETMARDISASLVQEQVGLFFDREDVKKSLESGFLLFAAFTTGEDWQKVTDMKVTSRGIEFSVAK